MRLSDGEGESEKKQRGSIAKGTVKIEGPTVRRAESTKMKKVSARWSVMVVEQTANARGYARGCRVCQGIAMKTPTSQTINPLCHLNRGRCVSRGRGRVVNRYWNAYRFIATTLRAAGWVTRVGVRGASSGARR